MDSTRQADEGERTRVRGPRTQSERDAVTVEISFALVSAGVLAGLVFLAVAGPALFGTASSVWIQHAQWAGSSVFIARVIWVLLRRRGAQPSQPGRTSPDS